MSRGELLKAVRKEDIGIQETATSFKTRRRAENTKGMERQATTLAVFARETEDQKMRKHGPG